MFKLDWYKDNKLGYEQYSLDNKLDKQVIYDQIEMMHLQIENIKTENHKNILNLSNNFRLEIYKVQDSTGIKEKCDLIGTNVTLYKKRGKLIAKDNSYVINLICSRYDEETEFCVCLFEIADSSNKKTQVRRYGTGMNHVFNTSVLNKRIQIRVTDGAMRFRDISMEDIKC